MLKQGNILSLRTRYRSKSSILFDTLKQYSEKTMEQFNSGELNFIFETMEQFNSGELNFIFEINFHKTNIGRMIVGNLVLKQAEVPTGDISIALIILE